MPSPNGQFRLDLRTGAVIELFCKVCHNVVAWTPNAKLVESLETIHLQTRHKVGPTPKETTPAKSRAA